MAKRLTLKVFSLTDSENEPAIRDLVRYYTSYYVMQNTECEKFSCPPVLHWTDKLRPAAFPATRMLAQTLSNLVTANDGLMTDLWNSYLNLPEEQLILMYVFRSRYTSTLLTAI